jgi:hydroxymethylpyrimidine pyrophosphatase-like HAD family hydrolase
MSKYKKSKVIAVDVDDTLIVNGELNHVLIDWLKKKDQEGYTLILWSMAGFYHAKRVAERFGIRELFHIIIPKPGYIVDDDGWNWTMHTEVLDPQLNTVKRKKYTKQPTGRAVRAIRERKRSKC